MLLNVVLSDLLHHTLFPSHTSVTVAAISLSEAKSIAPQVSLSTCSSFSEHSNLHLHSKRSLQLTLHQHKKARAAELTLFFAEALQKCRR